ncbi:hypothetical protein DH09_13895 [Bacillaceae bacterium JMAK1]|nr:hypothetical protein DH09_13895 [Bacillaceae bacterium JMAK1]
MYREMKAIFDRSNQKFLKKNKQLILNDASERALCGQLMMCLNEELICAGYGKYYTDVEYNRNKFNSNNQNRRKSIKNERREIIYVICDIIAHSRGNNKIQDNLIAIEMKKTNGGNKKSKCTDKERLKALTRDTYDDNWEYDGTSLPEHVCRYILGVYYEVDIVNRIVSIEYYQKGEVRDTNSMNF